MVLQELHNDLNVREEVFNGDDSHDVGRIFLVWILAILVSQYQASICIANLKQQTKVKVWDFFSHTHTHT